MNTTVKQPKQQSNLQMSMVQPKTTIPTVWDSLRHWLTGELTGTSAAPQLRQPARCSTNAKGIEIIKQFEGFPADVEPNVAEAEQTVRQFVAVPLTPNQFSALVSFTYHLGASRFKQSALLSHLNAGRYRAAAKEFELWACIGTGRLPQLVARRIAERKLFLSAGY
jgi:Phage lysozyme